MVLSENCGISFLLLIVTGPGRVSASREGGDSGVEDNIVRKGKTESKRRAREGSYNTRGELVTAEDAAIL